MTHNATPQTELGTIQTGRRSDTLAMSGEGMLISLICLGVIVIGLALVAKHYMTET
jgi:hypothetical protein